ncbi:hypothetical protein MMC06_002037 [Schaereria dolodes]|nr:hypothetical protein [Schaereria dolodes]
MDRALDDAITDRQSNGREDSTNIDTDWLHDKYEDDPESRRPAKGPRNRRMVDRYSPEHDTTPQGTKLKIENLHYDLTEDDLEDLFTKIGPVLSTSLRFDRAGRSSGTAFVTYASSSDARLAIREFDGANANGQPIRLTLLPSASSDARGKAVTRNPFDFAVKPGKSLFDRIEEPRGSRARSRSPDAPRRTDTTKPAPDGVDRYVPGRMNRSRSPVRRGGLGRRNNGGGRDDGSRGGGRREMVNGRPKKTQEDLDKEMEDYWGSKGETISTVEKQTNGHQQSDVVPPAAAVAYDADIDMIE